PLLGRMAGRQRGQSPIVASDRWGSSSIPKTPATLSRRYYKEILNLVVRYLHTLVFTGLSGTCQQPELNRILRRLAWLLIELTSSKPFPLASGRSFSAIPTTSR